MHAVCVRARVLYVYGLRAPGLARIETRQLQGPGLNGMANKKKDPFEDIQGQLLIKELEDEVRREQYAKLWKKYGNYVLIVAAIIVIGVGGFKWWQAYAQGQVEAAGARYQEAMRLVGDGKAGEATQALELIAREGPASYGVLAKLHLAGTSLKAGRRDDALAAYEALGKDTAIDSLIRDYARLQAAALRIDSADWTEMQNRLNDLVAESGPWRFSARELLGVAATKAGRLDEARTTFAELLADGRTPPSISQRAQMMMGQIVAAELDKSTVPVRGSEPDRTKQ